MKGFWLSVLLGERDGGGDIMLDLPNMQGSSTCLSRVKLTWLSRDKRTSKVKEYSRGVASKRNDSEQQLRQNDLPISLQPKTVAMTREVRPLLPACLCE